MIEVKRKEGESSSSLIRRFTRKIRESEKLPKVRSLRFKNRSESELTKKRKALKRIKTKKRVEYLKKLGKIE